MCRVCCVWLTHCQEGGWSTVHCWRDVNWQRRLTGHHLILSCCPSVHRFGAKTGWGMKTEKGTRNVDRMGLLWGLVWECQGKGKGKIQTHAFGRAVLHTFIISTTFARGRYRLIVYYNRIPNDRCALYTEAHYAWSFMVAAAAAAVDVVMCHSRVLTEMLNRCSSWNHEYTLKIHATTHSRMKSWL